MRAEDGAIFLQRADAAQAGRGGQPGAFGKLDIGDASLGLQMPKDDAINVIDRQARTMHLA
jgi:hypothetical protein